MTEAHVQTLEQLFGMGGVFGTAGGGGDAFHHLQWHVVDHGARMDAPRTQVVQRQVAGGLENEGFQVIDGPLAKRTAHPQVGLLQEVFGGAVIVDHPLQRAQQRDSLGDEDVVETRLTHGGT
ncbi:hypothetical protein D3C76_1537250 [compost metagenome]